MRACTCHYGFVTATHTCTWSLKCHAFVGWQWYTLTLRYLILFQTLSSQAALTYDEVVREMIHAEGQFIRDLNMIIKV